MKKRFVRLTALLCALVLLASLSAALAAGPEDADTHVRRWAGHVWTEGIQAGFINEKGRPAELFSYNGTVYIPLRTAGAWMGCDVAWEQDTQTVSLTSGGEKNILTSDNVPDLSEEEVAVWRHSDEYGMDITLRPDMTVKLDGETLRFANVKGEPVYPAVYRQVTYLPVRSIGELCGFDVTWVPGEAGRSPDRIHLRSPLSKAELEEIRTFLAAAKPVGTEMESAVQLMYAHQTADSAAFLSCATAVFEGIRELKALPRPSAALAYPAMSELFGAALEEMEAAAAQCLEELGQNPSSYAAIQSNREIHDVMYEGFLCVLEGLLHLEQSLQDLL